MKVIHSAEWSPVKMEILLSLLILTLAAWFRFKGVLLCGIDQSWLSIANRLMEGFSSAVIDQLLFLLVHM